MDARISCRHSLRVLPICGVFYVGDTYVRDVLCVVYSDWLQYLIRTTFFVAFIGRLFDGTVHVIVGACHRVQASNRVVYRPCYGGRMSSGASF